MQSSITEIEKSLWEAADQLRANSKLTATEYSMPVLGLIFLRFAHNRFVIVKDKIEATLPVHPKRGRRQITKEDFLSEKAIYLPEQSRFDYLSNLPEGTPIGEIINEAMKAIEDEYPNLAGVLPRNFNEFEDSLLRDLLRIFDRDAIKQIQGDAFGKIYEYFLNEFAITGAQEGGEFFTPSSLVNTIVNVICPDHGVILDPACGSAGMFVQTGHFIESEGFNPGEKITIYGQEKTTTNTRIAKMNLAVHGMEGRIAEANTFYNDEFGLSGKCDFVMANPPFNVDGVDKSRDFVKNDPRLLYTIDEGGSKARLLPKSDNANYLWIQYFYGYLNEKGRAGFVMASSASDAGHSEKDIRERLVKTGAVDVMIAIGTNFFYTRTLPCTLWFFDRAKEKDDEAKNKTLMLDARSIFRVVTRKINDFSPEQLSNITAIVGLYRGNRAMFINLIEAYAKSALEFLSAITPEYKLLLEAYTPMYELVKSYCYSEDVFRTELNELNTNIINKEYETYTALYNKIDSEIKKVSSDDIAAANKIQHDNYALLNEGLLKAKSLRDAFEQIIKDQSALVELIQKKLKENGGNNTVQQEWKLAEVRKKTNDIELNKKQFFETIKQAKYFLSAIKWLQIRFPDAVYADVEGLCKIVTLDEIAANDYSLTPGRYVGVAARAADDYDFAERLKAIHLELAELNDEASELSKTISSNFEELGL